MPLIVDLEKKLEIEFWKRVAMGKAESPLSNVQYLWLKLVKGLWGKKFEASLRKEDLEKQRVKEYFHIVHQDIDPIFMDYNTRNCDQKSP